jgi:hypothetical protein
MKFIEKKNHDGIRWYTCGQTDMTRLFELAEEGRWRVGEGDSGEALVTVSIDVEAGW